MQDHERRPEVTVRPATETDSGAVAELLVVAFEPYRGQYTEAAFSATVIDDAAVGRRLSEGPVWVGVRDGVVVGTLSAISRDSEGHLRSLAVEPSVRRAGIGRRLLASAEDWARAVGLVRLRLATTPFLTAAGALYERCGYVEADPTWDDLHGTPLLRLVKTMA